MSERKVLFHSSTITEFNFRVLLVPKVCLAQLGLVAFQVERVRKVIGVTKDSVASRGTVVEPDLRVEMGSPDKWDHR